MQRVLYLITISAIAVIFLNCEKNTESITGYYDNDTTSHPGWIARKPNIYIYPTEKINLEININFPNGGNIIESIPDYNGGWKIEVTPSGMINSKYRYLFYEAQIPQLLQKEFGWNVQGEELYSFFNNNLELMFFSQKEIDDFLDYWIPRFDISKSYVRYPSFTEDLENIVELKFSTEPENVIRVFYLIEEQQSDKTIEPSIYSYFRKERIFCPRMGCDNLILIMLPNICSTGSLQP